MTRPIARRTFLSTATFGVATLPAWPLIGWAQPGAAMARPAAHGVRVVPFDLHQVRLHPGPILDALQINRRHLMSMDPERLLHMFRVTAGLPTTATPLGGWEAPDNELRGHFTGHYLSACALMGAQTGDAAVAALGKQIVRELARCQAALGNGYLSAFPEDLFDRLRAGKPAWAPFYTLHKIMAGLLDTHTLSDDAQAWEVLEGMAGWVANWVRPLNDDHMARVLEREYGGMNDLFYQMAERKDPERWRALGRRFDRERIFGPLAAGRDELQGLHANTTIPQIIGAARGYELDGDARLRSVSEYFYHTVTERRSYCTGGTSNGESWNAPPGQLAKELSGYTQECCVTYNMQKLTRHVFGWTGDPRLADYYERAYYNGILGVQHPSDGDKLYYVALQSGFWKLFGTAEHDFWCCTGSMAESFSKLGDSIYFHDEGELGAAGLYVNLFIPSEANWERKGVRLIQETRFPHEETTRLTIRTKKKVRMPLRIRVPYWAEGGFASLNGKRLEGFAAPQSYFVLDRLWQDGDRVDVTLPMRLHSAPMPDDAGMAAVMYGPLVLAGRLGTAGLTRETLRAVPTKPRTVPEYAAEPIAAPAVVAASREPADWLRQVAPHALEFRTIGQAKELTLIPLNQILDERYAVYWNVQQA